MTEEEIIKVLEGKKDGKLIERSDKGKNNWEIYSSCFFDWDFKKYDYRIFNFEPYKNSKEFIEASKNHGPWLIMLDGSEEFYFPVRTFNDNNDRVGIIISSGIDLCYGLECISYKDLLQHFIWEDGTRCGIEEKIINTIPTSSITDKPRTWEEYCDRTTFDGKFAIIDHAEEGEDNIIEFNNSDSSFAEYELLSSLKLDYINGKFLFNSRKEAEAFEALAQIIQLKDSWIEDWNPNDFGYTIKYKDDSPYSFLSSSNIVLFPTKEMADEFILCFKDILDKGKIFFI